MERRILGATGISVSEFALGAMMLGAWGNPDHDASVAMVHRALDAGVNFIDTADMYSDGESEVIVGKALKGRRDDVVLATKFHNPMGPDANHRGNSRRWIMRAVEDSLRRLDTDWIDLYQIHRPDPATDIEETLAALTDLVRAGKIRAFGTSAFPAEELVEAHWTAERRGLLKPRSEQPPYSILARGIEAGVLPTARRHGMGVLTWSPLSAGWLSGRYGGPDGADPATAHRSGQLSPMYDLSLPGNAAKLAAVTELHKVAADAGLTLPQLAIAFVLSHLDVTSVIIGPRTPEQLEGLLSASGLRLSDEILDRIDEIVPPGTDVTRDATFYVPPSVTDPRRRRRSRAA
ncbi:aryl-alcohol dehydrogenase-like predicted oxidoreductase [Streptomonospora nanhaiensis]|uniref:Aryl-alcohol dehydrogenase-like predicted oxidoreductase n=1 Tax=Streptomonospora nanhaiensis TaxID=1323731 RepID=A0A853BPQ6_9ACTN|nr:aldo/keto reductase [Streptomonospora nanhaiensis]NYI97163.1 aryl-alcohol dehydrogenase-like predicted oxidoreductase [Streptomonospora nanhaiensis]